MSDRNLFVPPIQSWPEGYAALRQRAGDTRGWIEFDADVPDRRWPRTTGLDAIVIASFIDDAIATTSAGPTLGWLICRDELEQDVLQTLVETYRGNRDFWPCLEMFCDYLSAVGCRLPSQAAWSALLALVGATPASSIMTDAPPVWFARKQSLDKVYLAQREHLAALHGADRTVPGPGMAGGTMEIPRSTNAEVLQLASFWSALLHIPQIKQASGHVAVSTRWRAVLDDIAALAAGADPGDVYRKNNTFWRAVSSLAAHVSAAVQSRPGDADPRSMTSPRNQSAPPIRSWSDGYAALRRRAGDTRGWIELDADVPERRWPRTTGLDAIVIASLIDEAFARTDQRSYAGTALRWTSCKDDLERDALQALGDTYPGNRDFWSCLAMMCAHLAYVSAPLPPQAVWNAVLAEVGAIPGASLSADAPPVWFAGATSLDKLYLAQQRYLATLHGVDRMAPGPDMTGGTMAIPRSTNAEVRQLASFWSAVLRIPKAKNANGYDGVARRWRAALDDIAALTAGASPGAVYRKNNAFWRAALSVAIHVAAAIEHGLSDIELRSTVDAHLGQMRNAPLAHDRPPVWFAGPGAQSLFDLYWAQVRYLANLRGSDKLAPEGEMTGGVMLIPRSTNGEVLQLAEFWAKTLDEPKAKNANGYDTLRARWAVAQRDVEAHARGADPSAVYPKNHAFWRAVTSVAIHVSASLKYGLTDAQRWMASVGEGMQTVFDRTKALASAIAAGVRETAADAAEGTGKILNKAARGLLGDLGPPLLIGGGVLVAAILLLRRRGPERGESRS